MPPRPVLTRSTFAAKAPAAPAKGKPPLKKATVKAAAKKKRTIASKPHRAPKTIAGKPSGVGKPAAKPVAKKAAHTKPAAKKPPKKPGASKPRKVLHKSTIGSKMRKKGPPASRRAAPLERATFSSPICADRAPVMQAFGLDDMNQPLGEAFARALDDALSPQDTTFTDGNFNRASPGSFDTARSQTFPTIPNIGIGGGGGGGGGSDGGTNPGGGENGGGTNPGGGGESGGGTNPGGGENGGGANPGGGGENGGGTNPGDGGNGGTTPPAVPEPASWIMMILGFGLTGAALRRRRYAAILPA